MQSHVRSLFINLVFSFLPMRLPSRIVSNYLSSSCGGSVIVVSSLLRGSAMIFLTRIRRLSMLRVVRCSFINSISDSVIFLERFENVVGSLDGSRVAAWWSFLLISGSCRGYVDVADLLINVFRRWGFVVLTSARRVPSSSGVCMSICRWHSSTRISSSCSSILLMLLSWFYICGCLTVSVTLLHSCISYFRIWVRALRLWSAISRAIVEMHSTRQFIVTRG